VDVTVPIVERERRVMRRGRDHVHRCVDGMQLGNEALDSFSWDCSLDAQSLERLVVEVEKLISIHLGLSKESNSLLIDLFLPQERAHLTNAPTKDAHIAFDFLDTKTEKTKCFITIVYTEGRKRSIEYMSGEYYERS
jgi:hypothetical protein